MDKINAYEHILCFQYQDNSLPSDGRKHCMSSGNTQHHCNFGYHKFLCYVNQCNIDRNRHLHMFLDLKEMKRLLASYKPSGLYNLCIIISIPIGQATSEQQSLNAWQSSPQLQPPSVAWQFAPLGQQIVEYPILAQVPWFRSGAGDNHNIILL